jgi:hypothetical protein
VQPVSWLFAPTWGMNALRAAMTGSGSPWDDMAMCGVLSLAYGALALACLHVFLRSARVNATLALS